MKGDKYHDESSDSSVSSREKEKMMKYFRLMMKSNSKKKRREKKYPSEVVVTGKRSEYSDAMSEASDKRHKIGSNRWKFGADGGGVDVSREGIMISYDEYLKLKGHNHNGHQGQQEFGFHSKPGHGFQPHFTMDMSRDNYDGRNGHRYSYSDSRVARLPPRQLNDVPYRSRNNWQGRDRPRPHSSNGRRWRFNNRERFRDNRRRSTSYSGNYKGSSWNVQDSSKTSVKNASDAEEKKERKVYYVSLNNRQTIRNRLKLSFGGLTLNPPDPDKTDYYQIEQRNGQLINPIRDEEKFINPTIDFVLSHANNTQKRLPSMHDMMSELVLLNDQVVHLIDFKALVTSCRDFCFKLKYRVCEKREVPGECVVSKKTWSAQIVHDYDVNNHYAKNMKLILKETAQKTFEECMKLDEFASIANLNEGISFRRTHDKKESDFSGHACGDIPEESVSPQKLPGTKSDDDVVGMEVDECGKKETSCEDAEKTCYEKEILEIEKAFSMLERTLQAQDFFTVYCPEEENLLDYIQSVYHSPDDDEGFDWGDYVDAKGKYTSVFKKDIGILRRILKQMIGEEKQNLLVLVEFDVMEAEEEEEEAKKVAKGGDEEVQDLEGSESPVNESFRFGGFDRPVSTARKQALNKYFNEARVFLQYLPSCVEFDIAFAADELYNTNNKLQMSFCPCSNAMVNWRTKCGFNMGRNYNPCRVESMYPYQLLEHMWKKRDSCKYHKACLYYLMFKYQIKQPEKYIQVSQLHLKNR